jgi:hypothetical protein
MTGGHLNANVDQYLQAAAMNTVPPPIASDPLVTGTAPIEQILRMLGLAANSSDAQDNSDGVTEHERREALATEAAEMFAAQDAEAATGLDGVAAGDQLGAMTQQLPQAAAGIAAALAGALGGALQPLAQIPQQIAQGAQQVLQSVGSPGDPVGDATALLDDPGLGTGPWLDEFGSTADDGADLGGVGGSDFGFGPSIADGTSGGAGGSAGPGGTLPATVLGPPPVPPASTAPSSAQSTPVTAPKAPAVGTTHGPGIAGMPMIPPGAVGAAAVADKDSKADTKRVSVPPVRNGAPVQGRLIPGASLPPVTRKLEGKPVATRRIVAPEGKTDGDRPAADPKSES